MISQIRLGVLSGPPLGAALASAVFASVLFCSHLDAMGEPGTDKEDEARRDQQLKNMKRSAAQYTLSPADDRKRQFKFHEDAAMRFSNPIYGTKDGAIYVWSDHGRPQAILKLFTLDDERFTHEWQSLSENPLIAERDGKTVWNPTEPGLTFRELPDAPNPAESAAQRLRQMKSLADKFSSTYTKIELRLLIRPLFRIEANDDTKCLDGALFAFANGTAPLGLLLLEARRTGAGQRWHYAFARMGSGAVTAKYGDKEIFSVERYDFSRDPKQTFLPLNRQSVPKE
jgi:hypothetical protein